MPRTKGSKNQNINTAKNKNIININVNSKTSKRGKGRPRKQTNDTTHNRNSGGGIGGMAPPQIIISPPQQDNSNNSLLSSFMTSKILNESNLINSRTNMSAVEPSREQPSYFNARESIIPRLPETPLKQELKPSGNGPPIPPPPPPPGFFNDKPKTDVISMITKSAKAAGIAPPQGNLSGRDAMIEELRYAQSDEGKAEKAKKKAAAAAKKEAKKLEKETAPSPLTATSRYYAW